MNLYKLILSISAVLIITVTLNAQMINGKKANKFDKNIGFVFGAGMEGSGDYAASLSDHLEAMGYDVTGGGQWWNLELGLQARVTKNLFVTPQLRLLSSSVKLSEPNYYLPEIAEETNYLNRITIPSIAAKYFVYRHNKFGLALNGFLGSVSPTSDIEGFEFSSNGVELGASVNFEWKNRLPQSNYRASTIIELGFSRIPMTNTYDTEINGSQERVTENNDFGGLFLNVKGCFWFLD